MSHAGFPEEWKIIDIAESEDLALVVVGTSARPGEIVGIHEIPVEAIGGIVNRVGVGVSRAEVQ